MMALFRFISLFTFLIAETGTNNVACALGGKWKEKVINVTNEKPQ